MERTQEAIRSPVPSAHGTSRLKTVQTIVDKLKREPSTALDRTRDIAGLRILDEMDRDRQEAVPRSLLQRPWRAGHG